MAARLLALAILLTWDTGLKTTVSGQTVCSSPSCLEGSECFIFTVGSSTQSCRCRPGFADGRWNLTQGTYSCRDVDECETRPNLCGANSTCENTAGSYQCLCIDGTVPWTAPNGDRHCIGSGVDVCSTSLNMCGPGARCESRAPVYICRCEPGYTGLVFSSTQRLYICQDVDECNTGAHNCAADTVCENSPGSFRCSCPAGWDRWLTPLGTVICYVGNICAPNLHVCGNGTVCEADREAGQYRCNCGSGYHRPVTSLVNGSVSCSDIDECVDSEDPVCDPQTGTCENQIGSYSCVCKPGYILETGRTQICEDVNECSGSGLSICPNLTVCVNTPGGYTCPCQDGYTKSVSGQNICEPRGYVDIGIGLAVAGFVLICIIVLIIIWVNRDRCKRKKPIQKATSSQDVTSLSTTSDVSSFVMTPSALLGSSRSGSVIRQAIALNGVMKTNSNRHYQVHSVTERMVRSRRRIQLNRPSHPSSYASRQSSMSRISNPSKTMDYFEERPRHLSPENIAEEAAGSLGGNLEDNLPNDIEKNGKEPRRKPVLGVLTLRSGQLPRDEEVTVDNPVVTPLERVFDANFERLFPDEDHEIPGTFSLDGDEVLYDHAQRITVPQHKLLSNSIGRPRSFRSALQAQEGNIPLTIYYGRTDDTIDVPRKPSS